MISGGRRYKHITCEPHSTVSDRAVWSVEADDTNTQLVNLTLPSQTELELYDQWRQTIQTHNLWTSLYSLRQSCMISGCRRYKHTTCEPHSTVSERAVWSVEADDTNIQLVNLTQQSQKELYDQWRQTIQTYNLWTSLDSLRKRCMISGGRRYKHTTCEPHSTVSERAVWSVEADDTNIQLVNLTLQSQAELYDQWRQTIQTYNLWTSLNSLRKSCMISGGRRYKHTTCEPHSTVSGRAVTVEWGLQVVCLCRLPPLIIQLFLRLLSEVHKLYVCIVCLHWSYTSFWDCRVRFTSCMFVSSASTDHTALSETVEWGSQVVCLYRLPPLIIQLFLRLLSEVHKLCVCIVCIHWSYSSVWDCRVRFTSYVFVSSASTDHTALALSETVEWGSQVVCLYRLPPLIIQLCLRL